MALNHEIELSGSLHQTNLPFMDNLLGMMVGELDNMKENGVIGDSFSAFLDINSHITFLLQTDQNRQEKMISPIEESIYPPFIRGKLARVITTMLPYEKFQDDRLLPLRTEMVTFAVQLIDGGFPSIPFDDEGKKAIGQACMTRIGNFFGEKGIEDQNGNDISEITKLRRKARGNQISEDELADLALMSAVVKHFIPEADEMYTEIIKINHFLFPFRHLMIRSLLKGFNSSLDKYFSESLSEN